MRHAFPRRSFLKAATAAGAALTLPRFGLAQDQQLRWANLSPGFTILMTEYIIAKGLAKKHGLNLAKPANYTSVPTYYSDFVAGNLDVCIGSWDTFAARYLAGVPLQFVCTITTAKMIGIVVPGNGAKSIKELTGKILAAPQSTGTYRMTRAVIQELNGIDIESAMKVQNVDNPAAAITLVMANRADAGLTWEPNITTGLARVPDMRVLYDVGREYLNKFGYELPYFGVAIRKEAAERDPGLAGKVDKMFADCITGILANVDDAVKVAGGGSGIPPQILKTAITSGRLDFKHVSAADKTGQKTMKTASEFLIRNKLLPRPLDDGFFAA